MATPKLPSSCSQGSFQRPSSAMQDSATPKAIPLALEKRNTLDASVSLIMRNTLVSSPPLARNIISDMKVVREMPSFLPRAKSCGGLKTMAVTRANGDGGLVTRPASRLEVVRKKEAANEKDAFTDDSAFIHDEGDDTITDLLPTTPLAHRGKVLASVIMNGTSKTPTDAGKPARPGTPTTTFLRISRTPNGRLPSRPRQNASKSPHLKHVETNIRKKLSPRTSVSLKDCTNITKIVPAQSTPTRRPASTGLASPFTPKNRGRLESSLGSTERLRLWDSNPFSTPACSLPSRSDSDTYKNAPLGCGQTMRLDTPKDQRRQEACVYTPKKTSKTQAASATCLPAEGSSGVRIKADPASSTTITFGTASLESLQSLKDSLEALQTSQTIFTNNIADGMKLLQSQIDENQASLNTTVRTFLTTLDGLQQTITILANAKFTSETQFRTLQTEAELSKASSRQAKNELEEVKRENMTLHRRLQDIELLLPDPSFSSTSTPIQITGKPIPLLLSGFPSPTNTSLATLEMELAKMLTALGALELPFPLRLPVSLPSPPDPSSPGGVERMKTLSSNTLDFLSWPSHLSLANVLSASAQGSAASSNQTTKTPMRLRTGTDGKAAEKVGEKIVIWCASEKVVRFLVRRYQAWACGEMKEGRELAWGVGRGWGG